MQWICIQLKPANSTAGQNAQQSWDSRKSRESERRRVSMRWIIMDNDRPTKVKSQSYVCDNNSFYALEFNDFIECNFIANKNECESFLMPIIKTPNFNYENHKKIRKRLRIFVVLIKCLAQFTWELFVLSFE